MDRGEVEGVCQTYQGFEHARPGAILQGKVRLLFNLEREPIPGSGAPTVRAFAKTQQQLEIAAFFSDNNDLGRPVVAPPDVPRERLDALRVAFDAAVRDPNYLADAKKQNLDPSPHTDARALTGQQLFKFSADKAVDFGHIGDGRGQAGADGPDGLVGDHQIGGVGAVRDRALHLPSDNVQRLAALTFRFRLADAHDGDQPGAEGRDRLGLHHNVDLGMVGPTFGVADDDVGQTEILEHFRRNVARVGA